MTTRRARIYDALALLTIVVTIGLDQWTKALVVANLSPPQSQPPIPLVGKYLVIYYIQNSGAAFSLLSNNSGILAFLIVIAIGVVFYLYARMINTGSLAYKIVFSMIIGGAFGNLIDRIQHSGYVIDFLSFRIPEINYYFAIFNIADASISVGVFFLFLLVLFDGLRKNEDSTEEEDTDQKTAAPSATQSGTLRTTEQDAQS